MKSIAIFVSTPAQVHFYRNILRRLTEKGYKVHLLARDYGETLDILNALGFDYAVFSKPPKGSKRIITLPKDVLKAFTFLSKEKIGVVTGFEIYGAYTSKLLRAPYVQFYDSEPSIHTLLSLQFKAMMPFTDVLLTPESFRDELGKKHLRVASYKELAYLHPNYYTPNDDIFDLLGVSKGEDYVLLRFNAFDAAHDEGVRGFTTEDKITLVKELEKHAHVFISAEGKVPRELEKYLLPVPKSRIHDVIYHAKLLVGDSGTMTTEAAVLGTPAIMVHTKAFEFGVFEELEEKYQLIFRFHHNDSDKAIKKALELVQQDNLKRDWQRKREKLLKEKIDITSFMVWFLENYPESLEEFRQNPKIQYRFR